LFYAHCKAYPENDRTLWPNRIISVSFPEQIRGALKEAGISAEALDRIRLARGVVGKASYVAGAALVVLVAVAIMLRQPDYLLAIGVLAVALFLIYFLGILWFAHRHPGVALLEGAELIQWRQMDMAVKDVRQLPQQSPRQIGSGLEP
jgi:hypothetical protein